MKLKEDYIVKQVADQTIIVPIGKEALNFNGMITLNDTGKYLIEQLKHDISIEELVDSMLDKFDVSREVAYEDCLSFINKLKEVDVLA